MNEEELHQGRVQLGPWDEFETKEQEQGMDGRSGGLKLLNEQRVRREGVTTPDTRALWAPSLLELD